MGRTSVVVEPCIFAKAFVIDNPHDEEHENLLDEISVAIEIPAVPAIPVRRRTILQISRDCSSTLGAFLSAGDGCVIFGCFTYEYCIFLISYIALLLLPYVLSYCFNAIYFLLNKREYVPSYQAINGDPEWHVFFLKFFSLASLLIGALFFCTSSFFLLSVPIFSLSLSLFVSTLDDILYLLSPFISSTAKSISQDYEEIITLLLNCFIGGLVIASAAAIAMVSQCFLMQIVLPIALMMSLVFPVYLLISESLSTERSDEIPVQSFQIFSAD